MPVEILQLSPLIAVGDEELRRTYSVCRWSDLPDRDRWLEEHSGSIRAVVTGGHAGISNEMLGRLPALGIVAIAGVGYDKVDLKLAAARGIRVTNTPDVLTEDVADLTVGLMIATLRRIAAAERFARDGRWTSGPMELTTKASGRRYGIVGLGRIGKAVARRLEGFGGSIAYSARTRYSVPYDYYATARDLAQACDVLLITVAGGPATRNLIDREVLDALGPDGFLINVARGSIVDEGELILALQEGRIAGAGLDVYADEPRISPSLLALPNVTLTPHIGSATNEARRAMARGVLANLAAFYAGEPLPGQVV
jgi:lactate dehydrogenase-like 2-hydroxyacid dehydrogenase